MKFTELAWEIFNQSISDYHQFDDVNRQPHIPFSSGSIEFLLYKKNWIDTVQWHLEDLIRDPEIDPKDALILKRRIDASNQERTDLVEYIDSWFLNTYKDVSTQPNATINTESPAWAVDRFSILALKIYHMKEETERSTADDDHRKKCSEKLHVLLEQKKDLALAIEQLLEDISSGRKYMKVYKQMKMYNDETLNPILYKSKNS